MPDMLVRLYDLPPLAPETAKLDAEGIIVKRAIAPERPQLLSWVQECDIAFSRVPVSCFCAIREEKILGFACYEATFRGFFGPMGVDEATRGKGVGKALLLACLHAMYAEGYQYGVIGGVGPKGFYEKVVGAREIEGSSPGGYRDMVRT